MLLNKKKQPVQIFLIHEQVKDEFKVAEHKVVNEKYALGHLPMLAVLGMK